MSAAIDYIDLPEEAEPKRHGSEQRNARTGTAEKRRATMEEIR